MEIKVTADSKDCETMPKISNTMKFKGKFLGSFLNLYDQESAKPFSSASLKKALTGDSLV